MQINRTVKAAVFVFLQDPIWLLPQHRLVHAHPRHGHVQRDPYLRHDKWHILQVRCQAITLYTPYTLVWKMHTFLQKLQKLDSHSKQRRPIAASHNRSVPCWNSFPVPHCGFNGWISMLKSILGSLCREYHYVFLLRISSKLQSLLGCRWLGCSAQFLPGLIFSFFLSLCLLGEWLLSGSVRP